MDIRARAFLELVGETTRLVRLRDKNLTCSYTRRFVTVRSGQHHVTVTYSHGRGQSEIAYRSTTSAGTVDVTVSPDAVDAGSIVLYENGVSMTVPQFAQKIVSLVS
jgi:hypothetical protein